MKKSKVKAVARAAVDDAFDDPFGPMARYRGTFSVLTIHFGEGSEPAAVDIPYEPLRPRTEIHLPFVVRKDTDA